MLTLTYTLTSVKLKFFPSLFDNHLMIDDRCIKFDGDYLNLKRQIDNFEVWYKKI